MKPSRLEILEEQLSKILNLKNDFIFSVPWIQPTKIDSEIIDKEYKFIINFDLISFIYVFFKSFFEITISICKLFISLFKIKKKKYTNSDIIILSHLISHKHFGIKKDFYYGHLQEELENKGYICKKYLISHIATKKINSNNLLNILPKIDNIKLELKIIWKLFKLLIFCFKKIPYMISIKTKISVIIIFFLKIFSYKTQSSIRIGFQINEIIEKSNSKYIFITFEGHCYEKMISLLKNNQKIFSYQNTPLSINQFSLKFYSDNTLPDVIFCKNNIYKDYLIKNIKIRTIVLDLGDLNFNLNKCKVNNTRSKSILLIPEGTLTEVKIMIKFLLKNANNLSSYTFNIRFHPIFPEKLIKKFELQLVDKKNVFFSRNTKSEDLINNSYVIFRGSSLIFEAIINGLIPIYLEKGLNNNLLNIFDLRCNQINIDEPIDELYLNNLTSDPKKTSMIENSFYKADYNKIIDEL